MAVDDDADDITLMRLLFRKAGITQPVEVYNRGEDMIDALADLMKKSVRAVLPLLCFLDVKMPTVNGHELLQWIRKHPELDSLAVVMLSSSEHPEDVRQAAIGGAQCYLAKYPHPTVLRRVLDEAERLSSSGVTMCKEWFGLPSNLLLRWGLSGERSRPSLV
jgi:CheY-like chemotaxis protein